MIIITKRLKLVEPADVRNLIKSWLRTVCETGELPFKGNTGGVVVQMVNTWLKSYQLELEIGEWKKLKEDVQRLDDLVNKDRRA